MSALALLAGLIAAVYVWAASRVPWPRWRSACFVVGAGAAALAPGFGDSDLARHMAEHGVMISIAAPLIAVSAPLSLLLRVLGPSRRRRFARVMRAPAARALFAGSPALFVICVWIVHVPAVIDWIDRSSAVHALEHALLVSVAVLFWSFCLGRLPGPRPSALARAAILLAVAPACDFAAIGLMVAGEPAAGATMLASTLPIAIVGAARLWRAAIAEERLAGSLEGRGRVPGAI